MVTKNVKQESIPKSKDSRYIYAVGKRKTAIAQVRLYPVEKTKDMLVNDKKLDSYFTIARLQETAKAAFIGAGQEGKFDMTVHVIGGGINSQAEAIRLGVARALIKFDATLRKSLKDLGYLTRDARVVERKKPGLKKARKSPQWAKR